MHTVPCFGPELKEKIQGRGFLIIATANLGLGTALAQYQLISFRNLSVCSRLHAAEGVRLFPNLIFRSQLVWLVLSGVWLGTPPPVVAQIVADNPRLAMPDSRLHRPFSEPIFVTGHLGLGGGFQHDQGLLDYGASFIFRPGSSVNFLDTLHKYRSGLVLRLDYQQLTPQNRIFSGDMIIRHYFADRGSQQNEVLPFFGVGFGASDVTLLPRDGGGSSRYWSWLLEAGQEWYFRSGVLIVARAQYRHYSYGRAFITAWAVSAAVGIPVPW